MSSRRIYLDNAATTRLDPRVLDAMSPYLEESHGNPSSLHGDGRETKAAIENARAKVARLLVADPSEIFFTSSGTESDNMALIGAATASRSGHRRIVVGAFEHPAILEQSDHLGELGFEVVHVRPNEEGIIEPDELRAQVAGAFIVSIMTANNVVGTVQPIGELGIIAKDAGALFHTDAVQAVGKIPMNMSSMPVDLLSMSAHKIYGPKGIGALFIRKGVTVKPLLHGGGQEKGIRPSTENVPGIVGLGRACEICLDEMSDESVRLVKLRDSLIEEISRRIPNSYLIGHRYRRLPGLVCIGFSGMEGEAISLLLALDEKGFSVSSGSACSSNHAGQAPQSLVSMGFDPFKARGSLRISLGRFNTEDDVEEFIRELPIAVAGLRKITSR